MKGSTMNKIILQLNEDHHRFSELLNVLNEQMMAINSDAEFDCRLTIGILDYVMHYPNVFHHPLEERIFERLKPADEIQPTIERVQRQHPELAAQTEQCRVFFLRWQREGELSDRVEASELGKAYIDAQRQHMALEERELFPLTAQMLTDEDWGYVYEFAEASSPTADPVFGPVVIQRYSDVRNRIQRILS